MNPRTLLAASLAAFLAALPARPRPRSRSAIWPTFRGATADVGTPYWPGRARTRSPGSTQTGGINGRQIDVLDSVDYGYQAPRAVASTSAGSRDKVVGHPGLGHRRYRGAGRAS